MTETRIALHGATGSQGRAIAGRLQAAGFAVRPLDSTVADLADVDSLTRAYDGADAVVVQLPLVFDPTAEKYAETVITALDRARVPCAVLNPALALPPEPVGSPYVDARVSLARRLPEVVEVASVVGPAGPYLENLVQPWSVRRVRERGELAYPVPAPVPLPWTALDDLGDAIAAALGESQPPATTIIAGPEPVTGDRLASAVSAAVGREVRWTHLEPAEYREQLVPVVGADAAAGIAGVYAQLPAAPPPGPAGPPAGLQHGPTTVDEWAARQRWSAE